MKVSLALPDQEPFATWNAWSLPLLDKGMEIMVTIADRIDIPYYVEQFVLYPSDDYDGGHLIITVVTKG